jgi:Fic family protein
VLAQKLLLIDQLQAQIGQAGPLPPRRQKQLEFKFRLDWNYHSNATEGGTLTRAETRSLMVGLVDVGNKPLKEVLEMRGHDEIVREILKLGQNQARLSEKRIRDIHQAIIHEPDPKKQPWVGQWKTVPNEMIISDLGEKHEFLPPSEVPTAMHDLLDRTNAAWDAIVAHKKDAPHPAWVAFRFQLEYLGIHPFYDGNGRTARILTNLLLIAAGFPPLIVKTDHKNAYNHLLTEIQTSGAPAELFYEFLADRLLESQQLVLAALAGDEIEEPDDLDKEIALFKKEILANPLAHAKKGTETVIDFLENRFPPFVEVFLAKLEAFSELFLELRSNFYWVSTEDLHKYFGDYWEYPFIPLPSNTASLKAWLNTNPIDDFAILEIIGVNKSLIGLKSNPKYNLWVELRVYLHDFQIGIECEVGGEKIHLLDLHYSTIFTDHQVQAGVAKVARSMMAQIKANQSPQP